MENKELLTTYFHLLQGLGYLTLVNIDFALLEYTRKDDSPYWNSALVTKMISEEELEVLTQTYTNMLRRPTVLFENSEEMRPMIKLLQKNSFEEKYEDSFLFHSGEEIDTERFSQVKKVTTEDELQIFLKTMNACYQKDDPQNPYGELNEYTGILDKAWKEHQEDSGIDCFIVYDGSTPVAVSTLNTYGGIGYISNVGSLQSVRGKGFGKLATMYAVSQSKEKENTEHFVLTEKKTYPYEFYQRIGFTSRFSAVAYTSGY